MNTWMMRWFLVATACTAFLSCSGCDRYPIASSDDDDPMAGRGEEDAPDLQGSVATVAAGVAATLAGARTMLGNGLPNEAARELRRARALIDHLEDENASDGDMEKTVAALHLARGHIDDASTALEEGRDADADLAIVEALSLAERASAAAAVREGQVSTLKVLEKRAEEHVERAREQLAHRAQGARKALTTGRSRMARALHHRGA